MARTVRAVCALALAAASAAAFAAQFGSMRVTSAPEENFSALVEVKDLSADTKSLLAKLAPETTYARYNLKQPETTKGMTLTLAGKNPLTLKLSGRMPASEKNFPILMELHQDGEVSVRQFNVTAASRASVAPQIPQLNKSGAASSIAEPSAAAKASQPQAAPQTSQPAAQAAKPVQTAKSEEPVQQAKPVAAASPIEQMRARNYDLSKPVRIEQGYTPWSLGVLYHELYPEASVHQVLAALAIHNPEAFPKGTATVLKTGSSVSAPPKSLVMGIDKAKAAQAIQKGAPVAPLAPKAKAVVKQAKPASPKPEALAAQAPAAPAAPETAPAVQAQPAAVEPAPIVAAPPPAEPAAAPAAPDPVAAAVRDYEVDAQKAKEEESSLAWLWWLLGGGLAVFGGAIAWLVFRRRGNPQFADVQKALDSGNIDARREPTRGEVPSDMFTPVVGQQRVEPTGMPEAPAPRPITISEHIGPASVFEAPKPAAPAAERVPDSFGKREGMQGGSSYTMSDALDMAESFIAINSFADAQTLISEVLAKGTSEDIERAKALLEKVNKLQ